MSSNRPATPTTEVGRIDAQPPSTITINEQTLSIQVAIDEARARLEARQHSNAMLFAALKRAKEQQAANEISTIDAVDPDEVSEETKKCIKEIDEHTSKKIKIKNECVRVVGLFATLNLELTKKANEDQSRNEQAQQLLAKAAPVSILSNRTQKK